MGLYVLNGPVQGARPANPPGESAIPTCLYHGNGPCLLVASVTCPCQHTYCGDRALDTAEGGMAAPRPLEARDAFLLTRGVRQI